MPLHTDTLARLRRRTGTLLLLALASLALPAVARDLARIDSPGKVLSVVLEARHEGRLAYRLERNGETVIAPSPLGMLLGDGRLERNLELVGQSRSSFDETWSNPGANAA